MKTIIVDHDSDTEIHKRQRFNNIIPLLKTYKCSANFFPWQDLPVESGIIQTSKLPEYLNSNCNIIYALTSRMPLWDDPKINRNDDRRWLDELITEIPRDIIELANKGLLHIAFFVGELITISIDNILDTVDKHLATAGINKENITVYIPNFKLSDLDVSYIKFISIFEMAYLEYLTKHGLPLSINVIQSVNLNPRNKKFTCLNNMNKTHRMCIAASLYNSGKHLNGYFSYMQSGKNLITGHPFKVFKQLHTKEFIKATPFLIDTNDKEIANYHWRVIKPFFNDAYWNFVTESFFADTHGLTEKTFKPIVNLQPFIIFGIPGSLKALHDLGYETFHSVIDESYDLVEDHDIRMELLIQLAFWLVDMSDDEHIKMMTKIKPILEHNQHIFFNKNWQEFL